MNERAALLRAVCENPDDDTPRLVFADWLDEHDEPERAELIRRGLRRFALLGLSEWETDPVVKTEIATIETRMGELWSANGKSWLAELPLLRGITWGAARTPWWGGFAESLHAATVARCLAAIPRILTVAPVKSLTLKNGTGLHRLFGTKFFRQLRLLWIHGGDSGDIARDLLTAGPLDHVHIRLSSVLPAGMADRLRTKLGEGITVYS